MFNNFPTGNNGMVFVYLQFTRTKNSSVSLKVVPSECILLDRGNPTSQSHPCRFYCRHRRSSISEVSIKIVWCGSHLFHSFYDHCLFYSGWSCPKILFFSMGTKINFQSKQICRIPIYIKSRRQSKRYLTVVKYSQNQVCLTTHGHKIS